MSRKTHPEVWRYARHNGRVFTKETLMTRPIRGGFALLALLLSTTAVLAQDPNLARNLAATCANCHGTNGNARGDMKPLAGVSASKLEAMMADYKSGNQPATIMHQISKGYTDEQIKLIAAYFAAQKPAK
jgi:sulfide dehydrogenase cytochrome subunit